MCITIPCGGGLIGVCKSFVDLWEIDVHRRTTALFYLSEIDVASSWFCRKDGYAYLLQLLNCRNHLHGSGIDVPAVNKTTKIARIFLDVVILMRY